MASSSLRSAGASGVSSSLLSLSFAAKGLVAAPCTGVSTIQWSAGAELCNFALLLVPCGTDACSSVDKHNRRPTL
eukprot:7967427-Karenia_brevis.AAC.1